MVHPWGQTMQHSIHCSKPIVQANAWLMYITAHCLLYYLSEQLSAQWKIQKENNIS